jgi:diguanylate cyclase (GGDEF)-like protein/PAS domain S-box-containing protein
VLLRHRSGNGHTDQGRHELGTSAAWSDELGSASDEQLRLLVAGTTEYAIFLLSVEGIVMTWNPGAQRMKGYSAEEVVGRHFSIFYRDEAILSRHPNHELELATSGGTYAEEGWRVRKDGSTFWASVTITALHDSTGELRGFGKVTRDLTRHLESLEAVATAQDDQDCILEALAQGIILYSVTPDGELSLKRANSAACELLGLDELGLKEMSAGNVDQTPIYDIDGAPLPRSGLPYSVTARTGVAVHDFVWGWPHSDGLMRWFNSTSRPNIDSSGALTGVVFSMADVTERHDATRELERAHGRYSALVEHRSDVICVIDADGVVRYASPAHLDVYGEHPDDRIGRLLRERVHPDDRQKVDEALARIVNESVDVVTVECRVVHPDGDIRHLEVTAANHMADDAVAGIVTNSRDVTERVVTANRLAHEAMHDELTGLPNRALLLDRLNQSLARARRSKSRCAILYIDLDHFKLINDSLGHQVGDEVLVMAADRLRNSLRSDDIVARLSGDEFVILTEDAGDAVAIRTVTERVRQSICEPFTIDGRLITIDCSIGISLADGARAEVMLQQADTALYRAKALGRGRSELYDQAMRLEADQRLDAEMALRRALADGQIVVHYQPIVSLPTGTTVGGEALVRLVDDQGGLVPPDKFIPLAEDTGLILPLGLEVLRRACHQQAAWRDQRSPRLRVSVNLSARQLRSSDLAASA